MWYHLGGLYWQRASFDAVVVIAALLLLIAAAPEMKRFRPRHWTTTVILILCLAVFGYLLNNSLHYASRRLSPHLKQLELNGPQ